MAKKAVRVPDDEAIERTVWIPGWAYNFLVERAARQPWRNVKADLSKLLEQALREEMKAEGKEPGPEVLADLEPVEELVN
jgi:hypothetical protein